MTGVRQPVISRMEQGKTSPRLDTVLKILSSLGKTLKVVPISIEKSISSSVLTVDARACLSEKKYQHIRFSRCRVECLPFCYSENQKPLKLRRFRGIWWVQLGSNQRPLACQASTLTS